MLPDIGIDLYPILLVIGVILSCVILEFYFKKIGMKKGVSTNIELAVTISAIAGIIFAILFQNLYDFIENPKEYHWTFAMTFFGGLIGGGLTFFLQYFLYLKKKNPPFLKEVVKVAGACIPLAHGIGRIGCFLDGCCYGKETDSILGIKFTTTETKVWPTNLFEAIFLLILSAILLYLLFKKQSDFTMVIYLLSYGIFRFLIEFLRGDHRGSFIPGISPSQFWAILFFLGGVVYLILLLVQKKREKEKTV